MDMVENFADHGGIRHISDDPQPSTAVWAERDVELENPLQPLSPGERRDGRVAVIHRVALRGLGPIIATRWSLSLASAALAGTRNNSAAKR